MCLYSTYNNRSLEELNFQPIDRSVSRSSACQIQSLSTSVMCFLRSSLTSLSTLPPVDIAWHYHPLRFSRAFHSYSHIIHVWAQCLQIRRRRVRDPKQLCRSSWGSTYAYVRRFHNLSESPCLPLRAALAAFIKVEHALMHTHPRPQSHSQPHPYPCACPCACITHSGVDNSNGDKNKHQRHLINAPTRNFNKFFAVLPPLRVFVLSAF